MTPETAARAVQAIRVLRRLARSERRRARSHRGWLRMQSAVRCRSDRVLHGSWKVPEPTFEVWMNGEYLVRVEPGVLYEIRLGAPAEQGQPLTSVLWKRNETP